MAAAGLILLLCSCGSAAATAQDLVWIHFSDNGGYGEKPESISAPAGEEVVLPGAELLESRLEDALRFVGWSEDEEAAAPDYLPGTVIPADWLMLYAVYGEGQYALTYQVEGVVSTEEVAAGEIPQAVPELPEGYLGWLDGSGRLVDLTGERIWQDGTYTAYEGIALDRQDHSKYMDGTGDGLFHPEQDMTRAEVAQVLYGLLLTVPEGRASYPDVPEGAWYAQAVTSLGALGALDRGEGEPFQPGAAITRGDFAIILSHFLPPSGTAPAFQDVPESHPAWEAIGTAVSYDLFHGYPDGTFRPDEALTRAEAAVVFNSLLGREPDAMAIARSPSLRIFPDVSPDHWAYAQIMEATVSHEYVKNDGEAWTRVTAEPAGIPDGYYRFGGWLYRVQNGTFLRSTTVDGFSYDAQGRYTTGSATLDARLHQIIDTYTTDSMTRDQKLKALYNYIRDEFTYLRRDLIAQGQTGWETAYAEEFLELGRGNCYSFSATFCLLARQLGLPARCEVGTLGGSNSPHGWVEIELDGVTYMFDPQLEWRYLHDYGRGGYDLFMMRPSEAPFTYIQ